MFFYFFFFFNDTATTEIYTLSLHDALPISTPQLSVLSNPAKPRRPRKRHGGDADGPTVRPRPPGGSEEHTSELQSRPYLVCRLFLLKKKKKDYKLYNM